MQDKKRLPEKKTGVHRKVLRVEKESCPVEDVPRNRYVPQLKNVPAFILFCAIFFIWLVYGLLQGFPSVYFISYFAFALVITNLFKDSANLNSMAAPFTFLSTSTAIIDIIGANGVLFIHLIPSIVIIFIVNVRRNYKLEVMMFASLIYSIWMFMILTYSLDLADPTYSQIPEPFDNSVILGFWIGFGTFVTSFCIWILRSNCKSPLFPWAKKTAW